MRLDYTHMAVVQAADPDVQALRLAGTGLQLEDMAFDDAGTMLLCDDSTGQPRPIIPPGGDSWFSMLSMAFPTPAKRHCRGWWHQVRLAQA